MAPTASPRTSLGLGVVIDVAQVASAPGRVDQRAEAILAHLRRVLPFEAGWIGTLDQSGGRYQPLVSSGYDERLNRFFASPATVAQIDLLGLNHSRRPIRAYDLPGPLGERPVWAEYLLPAGFHDGVSMPLTAQDGRHLGLLTVNAETIIDRPGEVMDLLYRLAPLIADAVDPLRSVAAAARMVSSAYAGVVLTTSGVPVTLPGMPGHPLLAAGSPSIALAGELLTTRGGQVAFLCPGLNPDTRAYVRITALACPGEPAGDVRAAVLVSPARNLCDLTRRELEVLGMVVDGWPNQQIAAELTIAARTVAAHVEHILAKLHVATRTAAAVRAIRQEIYLPYRLIRPRA